MFRSISLRLWFLILLGLLKRRVKLVAIVISLLVVFVLCLRSNILAINSNTISQGFVGTYQNHDLPLEVTRLISKSLVESDEIGRMKPGLVSGWETNNDATSFKFKLKDNLYWSDGTKLKASDLEFNIPNLEISYPSDLVIEFKLKEPYSPFPSLLTKPILKKGTLIGIGPYRVIDVERSRVFITKIHLKSSGDLPEVIVRFYPNEKTAITGFALGEIQSLIGVNYKNVKLGDTTKMHQEVDRSKIVTILYNNKDNLLSSRSLRQALSFSAPKIVGEEESSSPYSSFTWVFIGDTKKYLSNIPEAKLALERAKSTMNKDDLTKEIVLTSTPNLEEVGKVVVASWKELGLNAVLRIESGIPQNFQALLITQSLPEDPDQYFLWHSTQEKTNLTKYVSKRADKDLEDGRKLIKEDERLSSYQDFQKTLLEDAPAAFLYHPKYSVVYLKKSKENLQKILQLQIGLDKI